MNYEAQQKLEQIVSETTVFCKTKRERDKLDGPNKKKNKYRLFSVYAGQLKRLIEGFPTLTAKAIRELALTIIPFRTADQFKYEMYACIQQLMEEKIIVRASKGIYRLI